MDFLTQASQLLLSLSLLIVLHELGHFIPARIFRTRVEKFYLFFDWKFSLFKYKKGETEYGIGWIPLGGYVKIAGMIDESMDKEQMAKPPQPWEFRAKPAWQRLIIMIGGVTVNLLLGFFIYMMILFTWGKEQLPLANAKYGMHVDSLMMSFGFQDGDKIVKVGNKVPFDTRDFRLMLVLDNHKTVTVDRGGQEVVINLPANFKDTLLESQKRELVMPRIPGVVAELKQKPALGSPLAAGDRIMRINGVETPYFLDATKLIRANAGKPITIEAVTPQGNVKSFQITPTKEGQIGISWKSPKHFLKTVKTEYSLLTAIPAGISFGIEQLTNYVKQIPLLFTKAGIKQLGGFGTMGSLFEKEWDPASFWELTAFLSIALAFMNILPIPALDGGHVIFLIWEMITGKPAPEKVMEYAQYVGMALLLSLMLYANGNDLFKYLSERLGF